MAAFRRQGSFCTKASYCPGGECGHCGYNSRSGYAVFRHVRSTTDRTGPWVIPVVVVLFWLAKQLCLY